MAAIMSLNDDPGCGDLLEVLDGGEKVITTDEELQTCLEKSRSIRLWLGMPLLALYFLSDIAQEFPVVSISLLIQWQARLTTDQLIYYRTFQLIPWSSRVLFGLLIDIVPLPRKLGRRLYIILPALMLSGLYFCLGWYSTTWPPSMMEKGGSNVDPASLPPYFLIALLGLLTALFHCVIEVALDGLSAKKGQLLLWKCERHLGSEELRSEAMQAVATLPSRVMSSTMFSRTCGSVVSTVLGTVIVNKTGPSYLILLNAIFCLLCVVPSLLLDTKEDDIPKGQSPILKGMIQLCNPIARKAELVSLKKLVKRLWLPTLFVFASGVVPSDSVVYYNWLYTAHIFTETQAYMQTGFTIVTILLASALFYKIKFDARWVYIMATVLSAVPVVLKVFFIGNAMPGFMSDFVSMVTIEACSSFTMSLAVLPVVVVAVRNCPEGTESTVFAFFLTVKSCSSLVGSPLASMLTHELHTTTEDHYAGLRNFVVACYLISWVPCLLVFLLPGMNTARKTARS